MPEEVKLNLSLTEQIETAKQYLEDLPPAVREAMGLARMSNAYFETFFVTLSKGALAGFERALRQAASEEWDDQVQQELIVLANETRARIQHIDAGDLQAVGSFA